MYPSLIWVNELFCQVIHKKNAVPFVYFFHIFFVPLPSVMKQIEVVAAICLFVVIGFALDDGAGAINLLGEDESHHLVGEGHLGEG